MTLLPSRFSTPIKPQFHLGPITVPRLVRWTPILAVWGTAAVGAGFLFLSPIPLFQHDGAFLSQPRGTPAVRLVEGGPESSRVFRPAVLLKIPGVSCGFKLRGLSGLFERRRGLAEARMLPSGALGASLGAG